MQGDIHVCSTVFNVRGWLSNELKNKLLDKLIEILDDLRFMYLDEFHIGPKIEDMITFLSSSPELARRKYTLQVFNLCCSCLGHVAPNLLFVTLVRKNEDVDLSDTIESLQIYLLRSGGEQKDMEVRIQFVLC